MEDVMRVALAKDGKIENVIVVDEGYEAPDGYEVVSDSEAAIGDSWDGTKITKFVPPTPEDGAWNTLRVERNRLLAETDWWALNDITMSDERKAYRQALRDLPATAGKPPTGETVDSITEWPTWPTKPS